MKYKKKPVVIDAWKVEHLLQEAETRWSDLPQPIRDAYEEGKIIFMPDRLTIKTLEGVMTASLQDYVIRGVQGELYPCKPDIFEETYDELDNNS